MTLKKSYHSHDGKKQKLAERETFSDEDSDEGDSDFEELFEVLKKEASKAKASSKRSHKPEAFQTNPKTLNSHPKESSTRDVKKVISPQGRLLTHP